jgi:hypothetical protein
MNKTTLVLVLLIVVMILGFFFVLKPYQEERLSSSERSAGSSILDWLMPSKEQSDNEEKESDLFVAPGAPIPPIVEPPSVGPTGPPVSADEVRKKLIDE